MKPMTQEGDHFWEEAATYPDLLGEHGQKQYYNWHFETIPVVETEKDIDSEFPRNVTWAINSLVDTLKFKPKFYKGNAGDYERSFSLRFLFHFMGDIHQPLHSTSRFRDDLVTGDQGGNKVKVTFPGEETITNLHSIWDSCWTRLPAAYEESVAPVTDEFFNIVAERAEKMMEDFPYSDLEEEAQLLDPSQILQESHNLAETVVYPGVEDGYTPSELDISIGQEICGRRVALGGYRLANLLIDLFTEELSE